LGFAPQPSKALIRVALRSGNFAIFAAILLASSFVSNFAVIVGLPSGQTDAVEARIDDLVFRARINLSCPNPRHRTCSDGQQ
jgi:hypothetical protein